MFHDRFTMFLLGLSVKSFFRMEKLDNWFGNFCILESWITVKLDI